MSDNETHLFDEVMAAKRRKPFVPFDILLHSGKKYEIRERFGLAMNAGNPYVVVSVDDGRSFDSFKWTDVAAVEQHESAA